MVNENYEGALLHLYKIMVGLISEPVVSSTVKNTYGIGGLRVLAGLCTGTYYQYACLWACMHMNIAGKKLYLSVEL